MTDKKHAPREQTRRKFIKKTMVGMAAGVGAAALGVGAKETRADPSAGKWFKQTDVIIIGSGVGGCASAIAARAAGASVLVLEKAPKLFFGGNSSVAGGNFYASPPEKFYRELMEMSRGRSDETAARALADNAESAVKWLGGAGIDLDWSKRKGYAVGPKRGRGVMKNFLKVLQDKGIEVLFETKANRLLQDDNQRIVGVRAAAKSGLVEIKAAKAVILATGGYLGNEEMAVRYIGPRATGIVDQGLKHITGDGHRMALDVGARLINMGDCRLAPMQPKSKLTLNRWYPNGVVVNRECQRFIDEAESSADPDKLGRALFRQPDGTGYVILDEKHKTLVSGSAQKRFAGRGGELIEADTVEGLAEKLGLNPLALKQTIEEFNAAVKENTALSLHPPKTGGAVKLDEPKFYAVEMVNGSTLSFGGVRINSKAQVVNLEGKSIAGLYAAGILVGGLFYGKYKGGFGFAAAAAFGRLAGTQAAAEKALS